jgi:hypothetical protein
MPLVKLQTKPSVADRLSTVLPPCEPATARPSRHRCLPLQCSLHLRQPPQCSVHRPFHQWRQCIGACRRDKPSNSQPPDSCACLCLFVFTVRVSAKKLAIQTCPGAILDEIIKL